jgi:predicted transcriptional regulator
MESIQVKDYMNHYPVTFTAEMVVEEAALRFLKTKQIGGPVIDDNNRVIGFLSESDVLATMLQTIYHNEHVSDVAALMRKDVLSVKPYDSVFELAQSMLQNKPKIYPVLDGDGILLGTICRNEVLHGIDKYTRSSYKP